MESCRDNVQKVQDEGIPIKQVKKVIVQFANLFVHILKELVLLRIRHSERADEK